MGAGDLAPSVHFERSSQGDLDRDVPGNRGRHGDRVWHVRCHPPIHGDLRRNCQAGIFVAVFRKAGNQSSDIGVVRAGQRSDPSEDDTMIARNARTPSAQATAPVDTTMPMVDPEPPMSTFQAAYDRRLPEITAVPDAELVRLNLDVRTTIATVLGVLPKIDKLRASMSALSFLNQRYVEGLEDYALATGEANSRYEIATTPPEAITALNAEAMALRQTLKLDATVLAHRGLIAPERLTPFRGLLGFQNVGFELIQWAILLGDCWPQIQGRTALTAKEINRAKLVGERLVQLAGVRKHAPVVVAEVARIRRQAMTLLVNAYDEVQRAVGYLRWHEDDADRIAPSLYADGRGKRRPPSATPVPGPMPAPGPVPSPGSVPVPDVPPSNDSSIAPGLPGASPFVRTESAASPSGHRRRIEDDEREPQRSGEPQVNHLHPSWGRQQDVHDAGRDLREYERDDQGGRAFHLGARADFLGLPSNDDEEDRRRERHQGMYGSQSLDE